MKKQRKKSARPFFSALLAVVMVFSALSLTTFSTFAAESKDFAYEVLSETEKTCVVTKYTGSESVVSIPSRIEGYTVTDIGDSAFAYNDLLTSVRIPEGVLHIGVGAFQYCKNLTSVKLPDGLLCIGAFAFNFCPSLTDINLPNSIICMEQYAFFHTGLTKVRIPGGVTRIRCGLFYGCENLTGVILPEGVKEIEDCAFKYCKALTDITIPAGVEKMDGYGDPYEESENDDGGFMMGCFYGTGIETIYGVAGSYAETYAKTYGFRFVPIKELRHTNTQVSATGVFSEQTVLKVECTEKSERMLFYALSLIENGKVIPPKSVLTVQISAPQEMTGEQCMVYRQEADGRYTDMQAEYQDGHMVFITDSTGIYVLTTKRLDILCGDVNDDGKINAVDARLVLQSVSEERTLGNSQKAAADANGDGKVNAVDARWILQAATGERTL